MSDLIEEIRLTLRDAPPDSRELACAMVSGSVKDPAIDRPFLDIASNDAFVDRLFNLYFMPGITPRERENLIGTLATIGNARALGLLLRIYDISEHTDGPTIRRMIASKGYGIIDELMKARENFRHNLKVCSMVDSVVEGSGFYSELIEMLEYPSEKVALYVLRQFYRAPHEKLLPVLKKLIADPNWMIRFNALQVLKRIRTDEARKMVIASLADDNIKVRDEAKIFINSSYEAFAPIVVGHIDNFEGIKDLTLFQSILELFELHPDASKLDNMIRIMTGFPESVSKRARSVILRFLPPLPSKARVFNRSSERYRLMRKLLLTAMNWGTETSDQFVKRLIEQAGSPYIEILAAEYLFNQDTKIRAAVTRFFSANPQIVSDKSNLASLCREWDADAIKIFLTYLLSVRKKNTIPNLFAPVIASVPVETAVMIYNAFKDNDIPITEFVENMRQEVHPDLKPVDMRIFEILASMQDPELPNIIVNGWMHNLPDLKLSILSIMGAKYTTKPAIDFYSAVFFQDTDPAIRNRAVEYAARIDCVESTELLMKAFNSQDREIAEFASKMIVLRGKERLISQINALPDDVKNQLGEALLKVDGNFVDDMEKKLAETDPKHRMHIMKLLVHLSRGEQKKVLALVRKYALDPDPQARAEFTRLLGLIGSREILDVLVKLLNDENARVRANAIEVVASLNLREMSNLVAPLLSHANNRVRANAIVALYKLGNPNVVVGLSEMLRSSDKWMRASATYALGEINDRRILPLLQSVLEDKDPAVVVNAIRVLRKIGGEDSSKLVYRFLNHENKTVRTEAAALINYFKGARVVG